MSYLLSIHLVPLMIKFECLCLLWKATLCARDSPPFSHAICLFHSLPGKFPRKKKKTERLQYCSAVTWETGHISSGYPHPCTWDRFYRVLKFRRLLQSLHTLRPAGPGTRHQSAVRMEAPLALWLLSTSACLCGTAASVRWVSDPLLRSRLRNPVKAHCDITLSCHGWLIQWQVIPVPFYVLLHWICQETLSVANGKHIFHVNFLNRLCISFSPE